jgi:predicted Zn-dependent protease
MAAEKPNLPKEVTFAPLFQILGKFVQTADATISRILAGGEWDEKEFGNDLKKKFDNEYAVNDDSLYLNDLVQQLTENSRKNFEYRVYVDTKMAPNAFAMPGGVIVFSAELLELLQTEAQVAAILSHEIAHIELDHCLNSFKFEIAKDKYNLDVPDFFSVLYDVLIGLTFSKTQEDEADDYAFNLISKETDYWPLALSEGFQLFLDENGKDPDRIILTEFFQSHPDMAYRRDKYNEKAKSLQDQNLKYIGKINLEERVSKENYQLSSEWLEF